DEKIIQIELDQDKAKAYNINLFDAVGKLRQDNFTMSSGYAMEGGKKFSIRSVGKFQNIEEVRNIPVKGTNIKLKDVADISFKAPERTWHQRINGVPCVKLEIAKESMANSVEISHKVLKMIETFENDPALEGLEFKILFSQGTEIEAAIDNLIHSAMWGAIFAVIILFFFLRKFKMTFIVTFSIPLSVMVSLIIIYFMGWTLNIITMMGLMISVGMVIDNAIVVLENIFRHQANGMGTNKAAKMGTGEVALAITLATLTSIVVFLPLFIMKDDVGFFKFYLQRVGTPVILSLVASLLVALVLIPLATTRLPVGKKLKERAIIRKANNLYGKILQWVLNHRFDTALM
ncbi:MAG: efflux RND transporter permease subunit, partial [Calditrichia bacterium]|nr:efflux RND transporter permease subunit [Calditrichia bacterium]